MCRFPICSSKEEQCNFQEEEYKEEDNVGSQGADQVHEDQNAHEKEKKGWNLLILITTRPR
jgi:hypothetical protein